MPTSLPLSLPDGDAVYVESLFSAEESRLFFAALREEVRWSREKLELFGRAIDMPRLTAWYGDPGRTYAYSGIVHQPLPWTPTLRAIKSRVEAVAGAAFNGVLLNLYRAGRDSMAWHSDDEPELGPAPVIASVSLGGVRAFQLKHRRRRDVPRVDLALADGSLLVMRGDTQRHWLHRVPKTAKPVPPRINLTFRLIL